MVKILNSLIQSYEVSSYYSIWRIALIGLVLGIINSCLIAFVGLYTDSLTIASNIAAILTATVGIIIMVKLQMVRPLIIASATAILLWNIANLTNDLLWVEVFFWNILLYILAYILFSWLCRYNKIVPVIIAVLFIVILVRIVTNL